MTIEEARKEIDRIDRSIVDLLNERYARVEEIGLRKRREDVPTFVPEREAELLKKLDTLRGELLSPETLEAIYREILSGARRLERGVSIACLGGEGTFSHLAAISRFGAGAEYLTQPTITQVFRTVESGQVRYGCVPVENSLEGVVNPTLDAMRESPLRVIAEFEYPIHLHLLSSHPLDGIERIYSHAQVFGQCRKFLSENCPGAELLEVASTVRAAELASLEPDAAAVGAAALGERFGLDRVASDIEDISGNRTRFWIVGDQDSKPSGNDKTSLCFALRNEPGALCAALEIFRKADVNLTMIESRPMHLNDWEYCFFADLEGHRSEEKLQHVCEELQKRSSFFRIFGSYPSASTPRKG